ncbi:MAG TPA: hypothetical protein VMP11_13980 [Verrucomicrobiae bacterium]|nr:hypothetical protein [Verrucomicrobiae bacterium]
MTENLIVKELQTIASRLTSDPDVQKNLMNEMFLHLVRIRTSDPDQSQTWYLKSCEFYARTCLTSGGRAGLPNTTSPDDTPAAATERRAIDLRGSSPLVEPIQIQGELITSDMLHLILPLLSEMQQQVLFLLMKGCGVREAGRELGITHPAVIKHRKKIARIAHELLQESEGIGVAVAVRDGTAPDANGQGAENSNGNGADHNTGASNTNGNGETHQTV